MDFAARHEVLAGLFAQNFTHFGELGSSVSIWYQGQEVVSLAGGFQDRQKTTPWNAQTLVLIWSATKGLAAGTLLAVLEQEGIEISRPVADFWPEFAKEGKSGITLAQLFSHQAGLSGLRDKTISLFDHAAVCSALAAQAPLWPPGQQHGYHARTFGFLLDELIRRLTNQSLGTIWRTLFGDPMDLDIWIGLPSELLDLVSPVFPAKNAGGLPTNYFWKAMADPQSLTQNAFSTPVGLASVASMNTPTARLTALPGMGGIATANSLAKWYAMLANGGEMEGHRYFSSQTIEQMTHILTQGKDRVTLEETAFSAGFMLDPMAVSGRKIRSLYGPSPRAFGHPGAGGSHAFADPANHVSFAYVMNQMELGIFPNPKSLRLIEALYEVRSAQIGLSTGTSHNAPRFG